MVVSRSTKIIYGTIKSKQMESFGNQFSESLISSLSYTLGRTSSAIVDRRDQVMRRDVDGVGLRRELVLDDGRGNQLSDLVASLGVPLNGHRGVDGRRGFRARHSATQGCEKGTEVEVAYRARRAEACLLEPKLLRSACFDPPLSSADGRIVTVPFSRIDRVSCSCDCSGS